MAMVMWPVRWHGSLNSLSVVSTPPITGGGGSLCSKTKETPQLCNLIRSIVMYYFFFISFILYFILVVGFGSQGMKKNDSVLLFDHFFAKFMVFIFEGNTPKFKKPIFKLGLGLRG